MVLLENALFVHVPKNAGSSIASRLGGTYNTKHIPMHLPARAMTQFNKPMFGFMRNPWHRMVSLYYFLWQSPKHHLPRVDPHAIRKMGFKRWLLEGETFMSNEPIDGRIWLRGYPKYQRGTYPGIDRLRHPELGLPPMQRRPSMWWLEGCDMIGKVERIEKDLQEMAKQYGFRPNAARHTNKTRAKPARWQDEYDDETIAHVEKYFAWDIDIGGYSFG